MLLRLGKDVFINGDVASARLLLRRAAAAGNAEAAFVLGTTFDPLVVRRMGIIGGMEPDIARARQWYERAAELGSTAVMMLALRYSNCASLLDFAPEHSCAVWRLAPAGAAVLMPATDDLEFKKDATNSTATSKMTKSRFDIKCSL
jgi:TPR repeat protein